ncbi:MAG: type II secretion system F family protein [bacterium]|nr:type II secretion system F family protein [bacterium]
MKYSYQARDKGGELQVGTVDAASREAALNVLSGHDLYILSLETFKESKWVDRILQFFRRVKRKDLMVFSRQFATLLSAKISLSSGLKTLYNQTRNLALKETIGELSSDIDAGLSLSQALERHPQVFSEFYINMVRSAEVTGRIESVMDFLADYLEKEVALVSRVRNALIYPVIVVILFVVVAGLMITLVLPQLAPIFKESGVSLPFFTMALVNIGNFMVQWWWAVVIILLVFVFLLFDYFRTPEGRIVYDELSVKLPVLGSLSKKVIVARFAEATSVLIKGGIPITQAIEIASHTIDNVVYKDILHIAAEKIRAGELMSEALEKSGAFPALVCQLLSVGEATGRLEELLSRISNYYTREVDDLVANLVELIQPALIIVIGIFVGILFASILLPIYNMAQMF